MKEENVISQSKLVEDITKMTSTKNPYFGTKALKDIRSKVCLKSRLCKELLLLLLKNQRDTPQTESILQPKIWRKILHPRVYFFAPIPILAYFGTYLEFRNHSWSGLFCYFRKKARKMITNKFLESLFCDF